MILCGAERKLENSGKPNWRLCSEKLMRHGKVANLAEEKTNYELKAALQ